jgi:hypothetical protein
MICPAFLIELCKNILILIKKYLFPSISKLINYFLGICRVYFAEK